MYLLLVQTKSEQILALEHALVSAEEALAARQEALGECQDMLAEMQGFSEAQRHRADQERAQAQVGRLLSLATPFSHEWLPKPNGLKGLGTARGSALAERKELNVRPGLMLSAAQDPRVNKARW